MTRIAHRTYQSRRIQYDRIRYALDGQDAMRENAALFLRRPDGLTKAEWENYVRGAPFYPVAESTTRAAVGHFYLERGDLTRAEALFAPGWAAGHPRALAGMIPRGKKLFTAERDHLSRMNALQAAVADLATHGLVPVLEVDQAAFYVAEAELMFDAGVRGRAPLGPQVAPPVVAAPAPTAPAPPPVPSADIEACFASCDTDFQRCSTTAEHFRLGVGDLDGSDGACVQAAEKKCGTSRSQTSTDCREQTNRSCQAEKRAAACVAAQTKCNARCR